MCGPLRSLRVFSLMTEVCKYFNVKSQGGCIISSNLIIRLRCLKSSHFIQSYGSSSLQIFIGWVWMQTNHNSTLKRTVFPIYRPVHFSSVGKDIASWRLSSSVQSKVQILILEDSTIWHLQCDRPVLFKILCGEAGSSSGRSSETALWHFSEDSPLLLCCGATIHAG